MDVKNLSEDRSKIALDWNETAIRDNNELKKSLTSSPRELRSILDFLGAKQFEMLSALNVKSIQQLLNIPLRKLLEIKLSNEQLQLLKAVLEKEMCIVPKSLELSADEMRSLKSIAQQLEKIDANDDDDDRPLVIDESIFNVEENITLNSDNERSLDEIEECFSKIKNVKIPQSQAALKGVKSELTEIIAELNGKEDKLLRQLQHDKPAPDTVNNATGVGTEEVVTTTSKEQPSNKLHNIDVQQIDLTETVKIEKPAKRTNGSRTAKRRRKLNKNRNIKPTAKVTNKASGDNTTFDLNLNSNETSLTQSLEGSCKTSQPSSEISALGIISQSTISDITTSVNNANPMLMLDSKVSQMSPPFSGSQGIFFINPKSVVIMHEDLAKATNIINNSIAQPFNKRLQKPQFNLSANESAVLVDVSESNSMKSSPNHLFATSNMTAITAVPLTPMHSDDSKTLSKEFVNSKLQTTSKPSKSFSAAPLQQKLQPTVLIKKLPTPLRKKEYNVDADSTTASIDLRSSKATKMEQIDERKLSCPALGVKKSKAVNYAKKSKKRVVKVVTDDSNSTNQEKPNISDNSCVLEEVYASERAQSTEVCEIKATKTDCDPISVECDIIESKHVLKSVSPESPLFESIKSTSEELDESGTIKYREGSSYSNFSMENPENQSESSYCSSTPNEKVEDSRSRLSAQRRIEFDSKLGAKAEDYYDSYDADLIVTIANTPLSPISSEIASPIEINNKFRDHKPATEIDGCGVGITYMLKEIDIPKVVVNKPDDLDLLLRTNTTDPRLLRYLKKKHIYRPLAGSRYN
ncbi:uncharacterized protein LOC118746715 isoform X2 [Rhagoletis pomonella]|uniref:uncharacterized protein LOC118746715 isoform X2 n=1 Tax=Rhagoletis pomonella TaxID=28610 RepID=UPI00177D8361|nr:uncharacterized protein LOC118746715 isoform X2 [Rhagoletis pomonella]